MKSANINGFTPFQIGVKIAQANSPNGMAYEIYGCIVIIGLLS